jgi:hypothetical protein
MNQRISLSRRGSVAPVLSLAAPRTGSSPKHHSRRRFLARSVAVLAASAGLMTGGHTASAGAAAFDASGSPGYASFPRPTAGIGNGNPTLAPNNYYVTRSPAYSGTQYVKVTVRTWGWNGSTWAHDADLTSGVYLGPGQNGWANFEWYYLHYKNIHAAVYVTWYNAATWQALGTRHADLTSVNDYASTYGAQILANTYVGAYIHYLLF